MVGDRVAMQDSILLVSRETPAEHDAVWMHLKWQELLHLPGKSDYVESSAVHHKQSKIIVNNKNNDELAR